MRIYSHGLTLLHPPGYGGVQRSSTPNPETTRSNVEITIADVQLFLIGAVGTFLTLSIIHSAWKGD